MRVSRMLMFRHYSIYIRAMRTKQCDRWRTQDATRTFANQAKEQYTHENKLKRKNTRATTSTAIRPDENVSKYANIGRKCVKREERGKRLCLREENEEAEEENQ